MEKDYMLLPVEIKNIEVKEDVDGCEYAYIDGLASFYNNIDLGRDRVLNGFFTEDLQKRGNQRPALWQHNSSEPIGINIYTDSDVGLKFTAKLPMADTFVTGRVLPQVRAGSIQGASIGYRTLEAEYNKQDNCRDLIKGTIEESSLVTFPMNPMAKIYSMRKQANNLNVKELKSLGMINIVKDFANDYDLIESKAVVPYKNYAMAGNDVQWDADKAVRQIRAKTGSMETPSANYKNGFMYYDSENPENFTSYKLPYVYVIDNEFKAVPRALAAIVGAIRGARGGVNIPEADKSKIKEIVNKYYKKMDREEPFKSDGKVFIDNYTLKYMDITTLEIIFEEDVILSKQSKETIVKALKHEGNHVDIPTSEDYELLGLLGEINNSLKGE